METKFNSQICTTREQSKRLIALGLKKETADMALHFSCVDMDGNAYYIPYTIGHQCTGIPAWSLHRLIEMIQDVCPSVHLIFHRIDVRSNVKRIAYSFDVCDNLYDNIIDCIEWLIKEGYFNKEYLCEK